MSAGNGKWSKAAIAQCPILKRARWWHTLSSGQHYPTQKRSEKSSFTIHPRPRSHSAQPRFLLPCNGLPGGSGICVVWSHAWGLEIQREDESSLPGARDPAYRSRPGSGHWAIVAHPLGVRLLHCGTLHVFSTGEDGLHRGQRVGTDCRQTHVVPVKGNPRECQEDGWVSGVTRPQLPRELTHSCGVKTA